MKSFETENEDSGNRPAAENVESKSQAKREARAVRTLASELMNLSSAQLRRLPLEDDVLTAIDEARKFRSHGARRRQLQYIAKLMRRSEVASIVEALADIQVEARSITARQHRAEAWRDSLLERGDAALNELLQHRGMFDVQHLRQLVLNAQRERAAGKPPAAARELFRALRDLDALEALPPCG